MTAMVESNVSSESGSGSISAANAAVVNSPISSSESSPKREMSEESSQRSKAESKEEDRPTEQSKDQSSDDDSDEEKSEGTTDGACADGHTTPESATISSAGGKSSPMSGRSTDRSTPNQSSESRIKKTTPLRKSDVAGAGDTLAKKLVFESSMVGDKDVDSGAVSAAVVGSADSTSGSPSKVSGGGSVTITPNSDRNMNTLVNSITSPADLSRFPSRKHHSGSSMTRPGVMMDRRIGNHSETNRGQSDRHRLLTQQGWHHIPAEVGERGSCDSFESEMHRHHNHHLAHGAGFTASSGSMYGTVAAAAPPPTSQGGRKVRFFDGNIAAYRGSRIVDQPQQPAEQEQRYHCLTEGMESFVYGADYSYSSGHLPYSDEATPAHRRVKEDQLYGLPPAPMAGPVHHSGPPKSRDGLLDLGSGIMDGNGDGAVGSGSATDHSHHSRSRYSLPPSSFDGYPHHSYGQYYAGEWREFDSDSSSYYLCKPYSRPHSSGSRYRSKEEALSAAAAAVPPPPSYSAGSGRYRSGHSAGGLRGGRMFESDAIASSSLDIRGLPHAALAGVASSSSSRIPRSGAASSHNNRDHHHSHHNRYHRSSSSSKYPSRGGVINDGVPAGGPRGSPTYEWRSEYNHKDRPNAMSSRRRQMDSSFEGTYLMTDDMVAAGVEGETGRSDDRFERMGRPHAYHHPRHHHPHSHRPAHKPPPMMMGEDHPLTPVRGPLNGGGPPDFELAARKAGDSFDRRGWRRDGFVAPPSRVSGGYITGEGQTRTRDRNSRSAFISGNTPSNRRLDSSAAVQAAAAASGAPRPSSSYHSGGHHESPPMDQDRRVKRTGTAGVSSSSSTPVTLSSQAKTPSPSSSTALKWQGSTNSIENLDEYARQCPHWKAYIERIESEKEKVIYRGSWKSHDDVVPCDFALKILHGDRNAENGAKQHCHRGRPFELDMKPKKQHVSYWFVHREVMLSEERGSEVLREAMEGRPDINIVEMDLGGDINKDLPSILMYMYQGSTQMTSDQLLPVRSMVEHLRINGSLQEDLVDQFEKNLCEENVLCALEQARELEFNETEIQCSDKIMEVFTLINEIEWFKLSMELLIPLLHSAFTRYDSVLLPSHLLFLIMKSLAENPIREAGMDIVKENGSIFLDRSTAGSNPNEMTIAGSSSRSRDESTSVVMGSYRNFAAHSGHRRNGGPTSGMNRKFCFEKLRDLNNGLSSYDFIQEISAEYAFQICKIVDSCWPEMNENMKLQRMFVYRKAIDSLRNSLPVIQTSQSLFHQSDVASTESKLGEFSRDIIQTVVKSGDQDLITKLTTRQMKKVSVCEQKNVEEKHSGLTLDEFWLELKDLLPTTLREILILSPKLNAVLIEKIVEYYMKVNHISEDGCLTLSLPEIVAEHARNFPAQHKVSHLDGRLIAKSAHRIGHFNGGPSVLKIDSSVTRPGSHMSHHISRLSSAGSSTDAMIDSSAASVDSATAAATVPTTAAATASKGFGMMEQSSSHGSSSSMAQTGSSMANSSASSETSHKEPAMSSSSSIRDESAMAMTAPRLAFPSGSSAGDLNGNPLPSAGFAALSASEGLSGGDSANSSLGSASAATSGISSTVDKRKWNGAICVNCHNWRHKFDFTKSQWRNRPRGFRRCKECTGVKGTHSKISPREISAKRMRPLGSADSYIVSAGMSSSLSTDQRSALFGVSSLQSSLATSN